MMGGSEHAASHRARLRKKETYGETYVEATSPVTLCTCRLSRQMFEEGIACTHRGLSKNNQEENVQH